MACACERDWRGRPQGQNTGLSDPEGISPCIVQIPTCPRKDIDFTELCLFTQTVHQETKWSNLPLPEHLAPCFSFR